MLIIVNTLRSIAYAIMVGTVMYVVKYIAIGDMTTASAVLCSALLLGCICAFHMLWYLQVPRRDRNIASVYKDVRYKCLTLKVTVPLLVVLVVCYGYVSGVHTHSLSDHERGVSFLKDSYEVDTMTMHMLLALPTYVQETYLITADSLHDAYDVMGDDNITSAEQDAVLAVLADDMELKLNNNKLYVYITVLCLLLCGIVLNKVIRRILFVRHVDEKHDNVHDI